MSYYRQELKDRLESEGFTYSLIHALGKTKLSRSQNWKAVIRRRLEDERADRIATREPRH